MLNLGTLTLQGTADMSKMNNEIAKTEQKLTGFQSKIGKLAAVGTVISATLVPIGMMMIKAASDANEMQNVVVQSFGDMADSINKWAQLTGDAMGRSKQQMLQFSGTMQAMLAPTLGNRDAAAQMSKEIAKLAVDMGSFWNVADTDALAALRSGLVGETEPLRRFGITMTEASLQTYALSVGLNKSVQKMSEAEKVTLRYNFILSRTKDVQGDAIRTSDGFANQSKALAAAFQNLAETAGKTLLPAATAIVKVMKDIINIINMIPAPITAIIVGFTALMAIFSTAITAINGLKLALIGLNLSFTPFLVGGAIIVGLIAICALFNTMSKNADIARTSIKDLSETSDLMTKKKQLESQLKSQEKQLKLLNDLKQKALKYNMPITSKDEQTIQNVLNEIIKTKKDLTEVETKLNKVTTTAQQQSIDLANQYNKILEEQNKNLEEQKKLMGSGGDTNKAATKAISTSITSFKQLFDTMAEKPLQKIKDIREQISKGASKGAEIGGLFGQAGLGAFIGGAGVVAGLLGGLFKHVESAFEKTVRKITQSLAEGIQNAFAALNLNDFANNIRTTVFDAIRDSAIKAFMASEAIKPLMHKISSIIASAFVGLPASGGTPGVPATGLTPEYIKMIQDLMTQITTAGSGLFETLEGLGISMGALTATTNAATAAMSNVPQGFKVALARWNVASPGIPAMASGGYIPARSGGTLVRIGEGGQGEYVVPANKMGGVSVTINNPVFYGNADFERQIETTLDKVITRKGMSLAGVNRRW
jgi:hypothetical protein